MSSSKTLAARIAAISKDLGAIAKDGRNLEQGYDFIAYASVSGKMRELLDKHGVAIIPEVTDYERDDVASKSGKCGYHYVLKMKFTVINADDQNDRLETTWCGESTDYGDKGINKAETSGVKYFYMRLFNVSEKGDADNDPDAHAPEITSSNVAHKVGDPRLDFDTIREHLDTLDDLESVKAYYEELKAIKQSPAQQKYINGMFNKKKQQLAKD